VAGPARPGPAHGPTSGRIPDARPAPRGDRGDPDLVRAVGRDRPVAPQAGPPGFLPGPVLGLSVQRAPRPSAARQALPAAAASGPVPAWATYNPNSIWIYDTTHFPAAGMAVLIIEDLVSRKWLTEVVSVEETSTQVELAFTRALDAEGLTAEVEARQDDGRIDLTTDDEERPILLAVSDNGPQMTSGSTREFLALCAIAQHFGRPGTPTDQAWIESLNGHIKAEYPHLLAIRDPATLRAELKITRAHYNGVRLHAGVGYVTPDDEHEGRGPAIRKARRAGLEQARIARLARHRQARQTRPTQGPDDVG
jgi:putative transposase